MDDKERIKRIYSDLKERVIDNYDYYYHVELLTDIGDDGQVTYLIDDQNEFLYDTGLSYDLKNAIDSYLGVKDCYEYLIKLVELKKIIDKKILSNPMYDENDANELIFDIKNPSQENSIIKTNPIIRFNPNVKNKEVILKEIFNFLKKEGYIDCPEDVFNSHFEPSKDWNSKILWVGENLISLVGLIDDLFVKNILPSRKKRRLRNKTVLNHFRNENGDLNDGSIKTEGTNIFDTRRYRKVHDFTTSLKVDFD